MHFQQLLTWAIGATLLTRTVAIPYNTKFSPNDLALMSRQDCQCAVCDVGPGDCQGSDLDDYNACVAVTLGTCGRSCGDLAPGTGAQDGCYAAEITRQKPCENACVQRQLNGAYCADLDPNDQFYEKFCG